MQAKKKTLKNVILHAKMHFKLKKSIQIFLYKMYFI
jgi:hypothetical protein